MADCARLATLKQTLLREVRYLCCHTERRWNTPIVKTLEDIRSVGSRAVFFGGTLRSLLLSRLFNRRPGRPRDLDIVVAGTTLEEMKRKFDAHITRETRFGGLSMKRYTWQFDVWPLDRTWTFVQSDAFNPQFSALPRTTFLNLEAVAVDVWPGDQRKRTIYSGDEQFFSGILNKTLEINNAVNPFPGLCVVRSLVMAADIDFSIGPRLAHYIAHHGDNLVQDELGDIQRHHYGRVRIDPGQLRMWINHVTDSLGRQADRPVLLPIPRQLTLWDEDTVAVRLHVLAGRRK